jgi:hypothetical protein
LFLYLSLLILVSLVSFRWLEMPAQRYVRHRWLVALRRSHGVAMSVRQRLTYAGILVAFGGASLVLADLLLELGIGYLFISPWPAAFALVLAYMFAPALAERLPLDRKSRPNSS